MDLQQAISTATRITDMNIDCLECIFNYLDVKDLLNVTDSCKRLKQVTDLVYSLRYGRKTLELTKSSLHMSKEFNEFRMTDRKISVKDLKNILQIIRCFGHLIRNISVDIFHKKYCVYVCEYLNLYCCNGLVEIKYNADIWSGDLKNPFTNVEKVRIENCNLSQKLEHCFPKVQRLELILVDISHDLMYIKGHFQHMEHLLIDLIFDVTEEEVLAVVLSCPNLRSLHINWKWKPTFFQAISEQLPKLDKLIIECYDEVSPDFNGNAIHFKSVKSLKIVFYQNRRNFNSFPRISLTFDALDEFIFDGNAQIDQHFFQFIDNNPHITKLNLNVYKYKECSLGELDIIRMALPSLKILKFKRNFCSAAAVLHFLETCTSLRMFGFLLINHLDFDNLCDQIHNKWNVTINLNYITLKQIND